MSRFRCNRCEDKGRPRPALNPLILLTFFPLDPLQKGDIVPL